MTCYCARDIDVVGSGTQANYNLTSTPAKFKILEEFLSEAHRADLSDNDKWNLLMIMDVESKFNPNAVSGKDVVGLFQKTDGIESAIAGGKNKAESQNGCSEYNLKGSNNYYFQFARQIL